MARSRKENLLLLNAIIIMFISAFLYINNIMILNICNSIPLLCYLKFLKLKNNQYLVYHDYYELVPYMSDKQFIEDFRMPKGHVRLLLEKLRTSPAFCCTNRGKPAVKPEKCLLVGIWVLATPDSYRSIAKRFAISKSTVAACLKRVIGGLLTDVCRNAIRLPQTDEEKQEIAQEFQNMAGMENVLGTIDGCHIKIRAPIRPDKKVYFNRKKDYSIVLQGLCDANCFFTNVDVRWPGSVHDARAFTTSDLYPICNNICTNEYYLIGDSRYPLKRYLMRPYRRSHRLSIRQKLFNKILSKTRQVIERTFDFLKSRFRRLYNLHMNSVKATVRAIVACCILHKICMASEDYARILIFGEEFQNDNDVDFDIEAQGINFEDPNTKRQRIVDRLWRFYTE